MISFRTTKSRRAFTLIELLIVITIIGILAVALIPKIAGAPGRARDAQRKSDLNTIAVALESYYSDYGYYPKYDDKCFNTTDMSTTMSSYFSGSVWPSDPLRAGGSAYKVGACGTAGYYQYKTYDSNQHYSISADLENDIPSTPGNVKEDSLDNTSTPEFTTVASLVSSGDGCTVSSGDVTTAGECVFAVAK